MVTENITTVDASTPPESPESTLTTEQQGQTTPEFTPTTEQIESWLTSKSHDDLKKIPAYNKVVQRGIGKAREDAQREIAEQTKREGELSQWSDYFQRISQNPAQLTEALKDDNVYQMYGRVRDLQKNKGTEERSKHATEIIKNLRQALSEDEELSKLAEGEDWEELMQSQSIPQLLKEIGKKGVKYAMNESVKAEINKVKADFEAKVNELMATKFSNAPEPSTVAGTPNSGGSMTDDEFVNAYADGKSKDTERWKKIRANMK